MILQMDGQGLTVKSMRTINLPAEEREKVDSAFNSIALAVSAYEASMEVNPYSSKFDYFLKGVDEFTLEERIGCLLFNGKGQCSKCHLSDGTKPLFTDFTYDNLGVPMKSENPVFDNNADYIDRGLGGFLAQADTPDAWQKLAPENMGKHKVPITSNDNDV